MSVFEQASGLFSDVGAAWRTFRAAQHARRGGVPEVSPADVDDDLTTLKDRRLPESRLDVHDDGTGDSFSAMNSFYYIQRLSSNADEIPARGTLKYRQWLDKIWKEEPILAGAVYSMEAKMQAMTWRVEGGRNNSKHVAQMLARARYLSGTDWSGFIGSSAIDFYTQDNGVWWDITRMDNSPWGKMTDMATIDTRCCLLTGNPGKPMYYYSSVTGQELWYKPGMFIHFCSMPLPDEREFGVGYCAVSRAARAAKLLMALHDYDAEKLANLPPEGIAAVTGLTEREFRQAIAMWMSERKKNNALTFPQVLWLIGNNPGAKISVDITSFSTIPESFDRQTVVSQYVNTLALCFGVDTREFWAISTGALGTASETEVQHLKAKGKGGGEFISMVERHLNSELPEDVTFAFDTQDIEEDMVAATVAKAWIDAYMPLAFPPSKGGAPGEESAPAQKGAIDVDTFKRLLADKGVLPEWAVGDERIAIESGEVHKEYLEDVIRFVYKAGKLSDALVIRRGAHSIANVAIPPTVKDNGDDVVIRGKPIPDAEVERGTRVTRKAVTAELDYWKTIPELAAHVPGEES